MAKVVRTYSDITLNFTKNPVTGDIIKIKDATAVKKSIENLIKTGFYERPFQPDLGSGVPQLLFENFTPVTEYNIQQSIYNVINKYEPRATIENIVVSGDPDNNGFSVSILFSINNVQEIIELNLFLERIR